MPAENLSQRKILAPKQASEAANQRPSKENATAESIVGVRAAGGNGTSSKVGRAEALTYRLTEFDVLLDGYQESLQDGPLKVRVDARNELRLAYRTALLASFPVEQPAAAPNDSGTVSVACFSGRYPHGTITYSQLAPSPADERAAFPRYTEWLHLRTHGEWSSGVPAWARDHTGRMNDFTAASAVIEELAAARASSANGTGAEGVRAWETDDGRVISDEQKQQALRDGGASASSVRPFSIALGRIGAVLSMAAEAVAIGDHDLSTSAGGRDYIAEFFAKRLCRHDFGRYIHERLAADFACALAQYLRDREAAPQPAQADARVGLTDGQIMSVWRAAPWPDRAGVIAFARALLSAHPGQPEPRAEVTECCDHTWASCHKGEGCEFRMWLAARTGASS